MDSRLCAAAIQGDTQSLNQMIQEDPLILDKFLAGCFNCKSPLHVATSNAQTLFVEQLLGLKPELTNVLDSQQRSALHLASAKGYVEIVKQLIAVSPEMCLVRDRDGKNPLHVAAIKGNFDVLKVLVGANPPAAQVRLDHNETILHLCVKHNQLESLTILLRTIEKRVFVNAKDNDGNTILHIAVLEKRHKILASILVHSKIDLNEKNGSGQTAGDLIFLESDDESGKRVSSYFKLYLGEGNAGRESDYIEGFLRQASAGRGRNIVAGEWILKIKDSLLVVASLLATMAFQAGVSPPGGVWQDDSNGHRAGEAVMAYNYAHSYPYFLHFNAIGFVASLSTIFLLLTSGLLFPNKAATMWILIITMCLAIASMAITYAFSNFMVTPKKERKNAIAIGIAMIVWCSVMALLLIKHTIGLLAFVVGEREERRREEKERRREERRREEMRREEIMRRAEMRREEISSSIGLNVGGESPPLSFPSLPFPSFPLSNRIE